MLPDWLDLLSAFAGGCMVIVGFLAFLLRPGRLVLRIARAIEGEKGRPGLLDQMREIAVKISTIEHQVLPNGGKSLSDAMGRVEVTSAATAAQSAATAQRVQTLAERLDRHIEAGKD